jgi:hypothetical protein
LEILGNPYNNLIGKPEEKRPFRRPRPKWEMGRQY